MPRFDMRFSSRSSRTTATLMKLLEALDDTRQQCSGANPEDEAEVRISRVGFGADDLMVSCHGDDFLASGKPYKS